MKKIILTSLATILFIVGVIAQTSTLIPSDKKADKEYLHKDIGKKDMNKIKAGHERKKGHKKEIKELKNDLSNNRKDIRKDKRAHKENAANKPTKRTKSQSPHKRKRRNQ